jgi:hypothetical protein
MRKWIVIAYLAMDLVILGNSIHQCVLAFHTTPHGSKIELEVFLRQRDKEALSIIGWISWTAIPPIIFLFFFCPETRGKDSDELEGETETNKA